MLVSFIHTIHVAEYVWNVRHCDRTSGFWTSDWWFHLGTSSCTGRTHKGTIHSSRSGWQINSILACRVCCSKCPYRVRYHKCVHVGLHVGLLLQPLSSMFCNSQIANLKKKPFTRTCSVRFRRWVHCSRCLATWYQFVSYSRCSIHFAACMFRGRLSSSIVRRPTSTPLGRDDEGVLAI